GEHAVRGGPGAARVAGPRGRAERAAAGGLRALAAAARGVGASAGSGPARRVGGSVPSNGGGPMARDVDAVFEAIDRWERGALIDADVATRLRREAETAAEESTRRLSQYALAG